MTTTQNLKEEHQPVTTKVSLRSQTELWNHCCTVPRKSGTTLWGMNTIWTINRSSKLRIVQKVVGEKLVISLFRWTDATRLLGKFDVRTIQFQPTEQVIFFKQRFYWVWWLNKYLVVHDGQIAWWFEESLCDSTGKVPQVLCAVVVFAWQLFCWIIEDGLPECH